MNNHLLSYIIHCVLGTNPSIELCREIVKISSNDLPDYRLKNILNAIKGGNPTDPNLQSEVAFMVLVECNWTLSKK